MTLYAFLEANQPTWREDIVRAVEYAVNEVGVDCFLRAVYGQAYKPPSPAVEVL